MTFADKVDLLRGRKELLAQGGGKDKVKQQHDKNKQTARERLDMLFDEGSFVETGTFAQSMSVDFGMDKKKVPGDGVVTGYGTVNGRPVFVSSQDYTVIAGSLGAVHAEKIVKVMQMAQKTGAPFISLNDSGGARIEEGIDALAGYADIFRMHTKLSGVVPQISVVLGPCAGGAAYAPALGDFVFMVDETSHMFITGPSVISATTGEEVTMDDLGSSKVHAEKSGNIHFRYKDEQTCIDSVKQLLSYLPDNNLSDAPWLETKDDLNRLSDDMADLMPENEKTAYDVKKIIHEIVDEGDFYEIQSEYAKNIVIGFGRINGRTIGMVANQSLTNSGALDIKASGKAARFVRFCDCFNLPIVTLTDVPGYLPGKSQEHEGIIRHGAKLVYAFAEATVAKINVIIGKAYGGGYVAMNSKSLGADMVYAWPNAQIAVMGPDAAANLIFRNDIADADDPAKERAAKIEEYTQKVTNPYVAAAKGHVDDIIEPGATRQYVAAALEMLDAKNEESPKKKHGNMPV